MEIIDKINADTNDADDIIIKKVSINGKNIYLIYSEVLTSSDDINSNLLRNIAFLIDEKIKFGNMYDFLINSLPSHNVKEVDNYEDILKNLFNGYVILVDDNKFFAMEFKASLNRGVSDAKSEVAVRGPKDAFNENFNTNLGLIRRRIKSKNLWYDVMNIGVVTKTKVGICYMKNIADDELVQKITKKMKKINIDGIIDSGYIKNMIGDKGIFPTATVTERPDLASQALLEGKIIIIVDNSPYVIVLPTFFIDLFHTPDDYYQKSTNISFIRIVRFLAFFIAIFLPGYYVAITTQNFDVLSFDMLLNIMRQRELVPFPALIEGLLMTVSFEILRESDMRMASTVGSAVSILGGLILGDALVSAGIVSPIMIVIVAISAISGLVFTSIELTSAIRFYRIFIMLLGGFLGFYGVMIGFFYLLIHLASIDTFGHSYMVPFSPFISSEIIDGLIKIDKKGSKYRNPVLAKKNIKRGHIS